LTIEAGNEVLHSAATHESLFARDPTPCATITIHYDTPWCLLLRGILRSDNPAHQPYLPSIDPTIAESTKDSASTVQRKSQRKKKRKSQHDDDDGVIDLTQDGLGNPPQKDLRT